MLNAKPVDTFNYPQVEKSLDKNTFYDNNHHY